MKTTLILSMISMLFLSTNAQDIEQEKSAIKNAIQTGYVEGLLNEGDLEKIDMGIHPDFRLIGIGEGNEMWTLTIDEWKKKTIKKKEDGKIPRKEDEKVSVKFSSIDITGTAAVAKIEFYVGKEMKYIDYIALYKFAEGWKMVNKTYYKIEEDD